MGRAAMGDGFVALYIFMLAAIAGNVIISRVPVILHTPLMSGSNFIHGIVLIGAMVVLGHVDTTLEKVIGFAAVLLGAGNAAGGYRSEEHTSELQSLMRISYAVFCLKKKKSSINTRKPLYYHSLYKNNNNPEHKCVINKSDNH